MFNLEMRLTTGGFLVLDGHKYKNVIKVQDVNIYSELDTLFKIKTTADWLQCCDKLS